MTDPTYSHPLPSGPSSSTPIRTALLRNLTLQTHLVSSLLTSLSAPSPSPTSIRDSYTSLQSRTEELEELVDFAWDHQEAYRAVEQKRAEVLGLERRVKGLIRELWVGKEELRELIQRGREDMQGLDRAMDEPLLVKDLIAHAIALSKTSSASASHLLAPAEKSQQLPWPTEMTMRQGLLFQMEGSMVPLGDKGTIGTENQPDVHELQPARPVHREENERRYDPNAVFQLDLGSDSEDE